MPDGSRPFQVRQIGSDEAFLDQLLIAGKPVKRSNNYHRTAAEITFLKAVDTYTVPARFAADKARSFPSLSVSAFRC